MGVNAPGLLLGISNFIPFWLKKTDFWTPFVLSVFKTFVKF